MSSTSSVSVAVTGTTPEPVATVIEKSKERLKGVAKVKPEFYVSWSLASELKDKGDDKEVAVEAPAAEEVVGGKRSKRSSGSKRKQRRIDKLKKKGLSGRPEWENVCNSFASSGTCQMELNGKNCKFSHDIVTYYESKPPEFKGYECPNFAKNGFCRYGVRCMFGSKHIVVSGQGDVKTIVNVNNRTGELEESSIYDASDECNQLPSDTKQALRKRTYFGDSMKETDIACKKKPDFRNKIMIAPLTTVGNLPFRRVMKHFGADITVGEMAVSSCLVKGEFSEWALVRRHKSEDCFGVQIVGANADTVGKAAELIQRETSVDFVDLNLGCPIDLIIDQGAGSALLNRVTRLRQIVNNITTRTKGKLPLGLKVRMGWSKNKPTTHGLATAIQAWKHEMEYGDAISYLSIHGRSRMARYTNVSDWNFIHRCSGRVVASEALYRHLHPESKPMAPVPVFGNGDILAYSDYLTQMERVEDWKAYVEEVRTDCTVSGSRLNTSFPIDAAKSFEELSYQDLEEYEARLTTCMIGRGALIKPWISQEIKEKRHIDLSGSERLEIYKKYVDYGLEHWGSDVMGVQKTRRFLLEWLSYTCRYVPVGILDSNYIPQHMNDRPPRLQGRDDRETLLSSQNVQDWIKISEMFLGPVESGFVFEPKHKSNSYNITAEDLMKSTSS